MSLRLELTMDGLGPEEFASLRETLADPAPLHAQIAGDAERFVKTIGPKIASRQHRTAWSLGATPTNHLADAYQAVEGQSSASAAVLVVPRNSRLRAAFGPYTLTPKSSKYLTIPTAPETYGRRAREFDDLFPVRVGPRKTLVLARDTGSGLQTMYLLTDRADIPEDKTLLPFEELAEAARDSAEEFIDTAIEASLSS